MSLAYDNDLAHYGKKGMKWGVTNDTASGGGQNGSDSGSAAGEGKQSRFTPGQKKAIVGGVVVVGAVAAAVVLQRSGKLDMSVINKSNAKKALEYAKEHQDQIKTAGGAAVGVGQRVKAARDQAKEREQQEREEEYRRLAAEDQAYNQRAVDGTNRALDSVLGPQSSPYVSNVMAQYGQMPMEYFPQPGVVPRTPQDA